MKIKIEIDTDNAAFGESDEECAAEVASILRECANRFEWPIIGDLEGWSFPVRDRNGNTCGVCGAVTKEG